MKTKKNALIVTIIMIACLATGCSLFSFDASGYIKACLDANMHGEFEEYAKITNNSVEDIEKLYNDFLDTDLSFLKQYNVSEDKEQQFRELFINLYKKTQYEVGGATKESDGSYTVPVTVHKMIIFKSVMETLEDDVTAWAESQVSSGTTPSNDEIYNYVLDYMYDKIAAEVDNPTYDEPQATTIKVSKNSDNVYAVDQNELQSLFESLIDLEAAGY
ncbi:MAG: hypothetical protein IJ661_11045 [Lachnospiraceae bacterium]|nr:hypothetical protein [Lachnospiraceae bacterium]